ncbi:carcinoembryonic antigen-related cell adhesion molecule 6-like [Gigantopelta aegis]|uniref:carcinoembryonic antigen-related cell adhesion molecule 6-like n=1 Tax=Gigantopelta aegis TaxID=1735272 RepID=UPI001B8895F8|nr:carcinoembryonic antigen-related cell adhesion molecule 6-like [Gigantopelta aegis]
MTFSRIIFEVILIIALIRDNSVEGTAATSIDCMNGGYPGQSTNLTCTITGTVISGIYWLRPNSGSRIQVVRCNTANTRCVSDASGYSAVVDSPTQITLTIQSFNPAVDAGEWICRDGPTGEGQSTCNMTVQYGPVPGSINFNSTASVEEGHDLTVDCTASCNPPCDYSWTLGDNQITTSPLLNVTDISRNQDGNVYNCTATNIVLLTSINKHFTLTVTYPERMSALSAGAISGIVIAVVLALAIPTVWILYARKIKKRAEDVQNESNN